MKRDPRLVRLSREHTQALMLALRIEREAAGASEEELRTLFSKLIRFWAAGLLPHFTAESECLLARLVRHLPQDHELVTRLQQDHLGLEALVASMRDAQTLIERRSLILQFGAMLRTHVRWEEHTLFVKTEQQLTDDELNALGADLDERLPVSPLPWDRT